MEKEVVFKELKRIGCNAGADLVGICDVALLKKEDPDADAEKFLLGAKSIVIALVADPPYISSAKDPYIYSRLSYPGYMKADGACASMRAELENEGYLTARVEREAVHAFDRSGRPSKTIPIKKAAELAGLGKIGMHSLLVNPKFGPRVRMSAFITDAPLTPDKPFEGELCDSCGECARACPAGAIGEDFSFDFMKCSAYLFGGLKIREIYDETGEFYPDKIIPNLTRLGETAAGWLKSFSEGRRLYYSCGECVRFCNIHERLAK